MAKASGWIWWHDEVCAIADRPVRLKRDERGRLHSHDGLAIGYPDGWGVYASHGVRVNEQIIMKPETLKPEQIMGEANAEVRRVMVERFGLDRFIVAAKAKELHQHDRGTLYKIDWQGDEPIVAVKVKCSTTGQIYFLRVPPQITKADQAVAWTFGYEKVKEYAPVKET